MGVGSTIRTWFLSALMAVSLLCSFGKASAQGVSEYEVKAVFLYNFVMFVEWPESAFATAEPFVIGVAGGDVFSNLLREVVSGESYQGRRIVVRNVSSANDASSCHILYIHSSYPGTTEMLAATLGAPVLTAGDAPNFINEGGMIRFFLEQNKVKIEVNPNRVNEQTLKISSKLLRLAKIYNTK